MRKKIREAALVREKADSGDDGHVSVWFPRTTRCCICFPKPSPASLHLWSPCVCFLTPIFYLIQKFDRSPQRPSVPTESRAPGGNASGPRTAASGPQRPTLSVPPVRPVPTPPNVSAPCLEKHKVPARPQRVLSQLNAA